MQRDELCGSGCLKSSLEVVQLRISSRIENRVLEITRRRSNKA